MYNLFIIFKCQFAEKIVDYKQIKCLFFFYKKPELYLNEIERIKLYLGNKVY